MIYGHRFHQARMSESMLEATSPPWPGRSSSSSAKHSVVPCRPSPSSISASSRLAATHSSLPGISSPLFSPRLSQLNRNEAAPKKLGQAELLLELLAGGGGGDRTADHLDELLERHAAELSGNADEEYSNVRFNPRSADLEKLLPVFADVLLRPRLQADRF